MSEQDAKVIAAMKRYDAAPVGSPERIEAATALDKLIGHLSDRDKARIGRVYVEERKS